MLSGTFAQNITVALDSITVISTRQEQFVVETGRNIQVISGADFQKNPVNSIDELIKFVPGNVVNSRGGFGVQSDFNLRGGTFNQVLILVDGVRFTDPLTGHFNGYIPVPLSEIDRIEIIKGPASAIYGSEAFGGVINIITKKTPIGSNVTGKLGFRAGAHNFWGVDAGMLLKKRKWTWYIGYFSNNSTGERFDNINRKLVLSSPEHYHTFFNIHTLSASVGRELSSGWQLRLRVSYDWRKFNAKYFYTNSPYDESVENTSLVHSNLHLEQNRASGNIRIDLMYRENHDHFNFNPLFSSNNHNTRYTLLQYIQEYFISNHHRLVFGFQGDLRSIRSNDRGNHQDWHIGAFGQWTSQLFGGTSVLALRTDFDSNYGLVLTPQWNFSYKLNKIVFRGGIGKGIRRADYTERYISNNLPTLTPGRNIGNPDLKTEQSWNYELGLDWFLDSLKNWKVVLTGFHRNGTDLIDYFPTRGSQITNVPVVLIDTAQYLYARNIANVKTYGLELEFWFSHHFSPDLILSGNVGYTAIKTDGVEEMVSKYLSAYTRHLINGNIRFDIYRYSFSFSGLFKERTTDFSQKLEILIEPRYFIANAGVSISFLQRRLQAGCQITNIFNETYQDILGAMMPNRWWLLNVSYVF